MDLIIKIALVVIFFGFTIGVGVYARKHSSTVNGFLMGGRSVGPWLTAFAYGTSYFSAVIFIGYAGQFGWKYGVAATWIGIGNAVFGSLFAWLVLAKRTRILSHHFESATMPEYFGKRFMSKPIKIAASVLVFIFLIPYTASLYNGLSRLFEMAFGIDFIWCVIAMAVITAIYVLLGGYMATAINDFVQGIIMLAGIVIVIVAVLRANGGLVEAVKGLQAIDPALGSAAGPDLLSLIFVVMLTSFGTWGLPQMVQKFYAIKDNKAIFRGTIISTVFALIVAGGCYFLGGFGRLYSGSIEYGANGSPAFDSIVPTMLSTLPSAIIALVIVLVLAASLSTLSSLVLTSSSALVIDFIMPIRKKKIEQKSQMFLIRLFIVFFIIVSAVIAIIQVKFNIAFIAQMMGISWGALAGSFLAPFMLSLYSKKVSRASVWASFAFGSGLLVFQMICKFANVTFGNPVIAFIMSSSINAGVVAMAGGLIIVPLVSLIFPDKKVTEFASNEFAKIDFKN